MEYRSTGPGRARTDLGFEPDRIVFGASVSGKPQLVPKPLANDGRAELQPSLSPDGTRVVYRWRSPALDGLYVKPVATGAPTPLLTSDSARFARAGYSKWSPRGDLISFLVQEDASNPHIRALYVVSPSGGSPRRLAAIAGVGVCWAPDGGSLGFADRNSTGEPFSIFSMSIETGQRQRLTEPSPGSFGDTECAFSPEGNRLAVARFSSHTQSDLHVVRLGDKRSNSIDRLTFDFGGIHGIAWSPDGRSLVFGSQNGLWKVDSSAGDSDHNMTQVTGAGTRITSPTFSRPSSGQPPRLAYESTTWDVNLWRWQREADGPGDDQQVARLYAVGRSSSTLAGWSSHCVCIEPYWCERDLGFECRWVGCQTDYIPSRANSHFASVVSRRATAGLLVTGGRQSGHLSDRRRRFQIRPPDLGALSRREAELVARRKVDLFSIRPRRHRSDLEGLVRGRHSRARHDGSRFSRL